MSPLYEYFHAADDDQARALAGVPEAELDRLAPHALDFAVVVPQLLALITDFPWSSERVKFTVVWPLPETNPAGQAWTDLPKESPWATGPWVMNLGTDLCDGFAAADDAQLPQIVDRWRHLPEFPEAHDADWALARASELVALARRARTAGHAMYCRLTV